MLATKLSILKQFNYLYSGPVYNSNASRQNLQIIIKLRTDIVTLIFVLDGEKKQYPKINKGPGNMEIGEEPAACIAAWHCSGSVCKLSAGVCIIIAMITVEDASLAIEQRMIRCDAVR